jgi:hypothetical protein
VDADPPHRIEVEEDRRGFVRVRFDGSMDMAGALALFTTLDGHAAYVPGMPVLYDLCDADLTPFDGDRIRALLGRVNHRERSTRAAILVGRDVEFGILRMWMAYSDDGTFNRRLFRDRAEAETWVSGG